jgi:hypothetical protein
MKTLKTFRGYLAIDQYGIKVLLKKYPRKELMEHHSVQHISKMFREMNNGRDNIHAGYIVSGHWYDVYEVYSWEKNYENV